MSRRWPALVCCSSAPRWLASWIPARRAARIRADGGDQRRVKSEVRREGIHLLCLETSHRRPTCVLFPITWEGEGMDRDVVELLQGTLDVLILRTLAWQPMHGYAVSRWIHERTDGTIEIEDAPLYKALHRLERAGCVTRGVGLVGEQPPRALLPADRGRAVAGSRSRSRPGVVMQPRCPACWSRPDARASSSSGAARAP